MMRGDEGYLLALASPPNAATVATTRSQAEKSAAAIWTWVLPEELGFAVNVANC
ncbi:hypothetical protein ACLB1S_02240 [Escherichia coli]